MAANVQAVRMASTISACGFPWWAVQRTRLESSLTGRGSPRPDAPTPGTQTGTLSHRCTTHLDLDTASRRDALLFSFAETPSSGAWMGVRSKVHRGSGYLLGCIHISI